MPEAHQKLAPYLEHGDLETRRHALWAIGEFGGPRAVPLVLSALENEENGDFRKFGRGVLLKILDGNSAADLVSGFDAQDEFVKRLCAEGLGKIGGKAAEQTLLQIVREGLETPGVRRAAIAGLGDIGEKCAAAVPKTALSGEAVAAMKAALSDENEHVCAEACHSLGRLREFSARALLVQILMDKEKDSAAREGAAWALGKLKGEESEAALLSVLETHMVKVGIGEGKEVEMRDPVEKNWLLRTQAASSLGRAGRAVSLPLLEEISEQDSSFYVRRAARESIAKIRKREEKGGNGKNGGNGHGKADAMNTHEMTALALKAMVPGKGNGGHRAEKSAAQPALAKQAVTA